MPDQYTDDQIQAKIAERRAKTEEQRKRKKRRSLIQILCAFAALIVLVVAVVFGIRYTLSRMKANAPADNPDQTIQTDPEENPPMNPIEETEPNGEGPSWNTHPEDEQQPDDTENPPEENPEDNPDQTSEPGEENPDGTGTEPDTPAEPELGEEAEMEIAPGRFSDTVIVVDAGRGYSDHGCTSDYLNHSENYESQINLAVAKLVAQRLREYGFTVLMTHTTNAIPEGEETHELDQLTRVDMANDAGSYLYLSLHCDNFPDNEKASGTRLYYCTDRNGSARYADSLAASVRDEMGTAPRIAGYATDQAFIVTSQVTCPSVLVELGFVTNPRDAENLLDETWRGRIASALAAGVIAYFESH